MTGANRPAGSVPRRDEPFELGCGATAEMPTGAPRREFLHVDDLARAVVTLLEHYDDPSPINIGTGEDLTIRELAEMIAGIEPRLELGLGHCRVDLGVEPLEGVGRPDLRPVGDGERGERQELLLGVGEHRRHVQEGEAERVGDDVELLGGIRHGSTLGSPIPSSSSRRT